MSDATFVAAVSVAGVLLIARRCRPTPARLVALRPQPAAGRAFTTLRPGSRRVVTTVVALLGALMAGPIAGAFVVALALVWPHLVTRRSARRRVAIVATAFPDFVDLLVLTIRSGCTPVQAMRILADTIDGPVHDAVTEVDRRVGNGTRFADAVVALADCLGIIARPLADSLSLADRHGTPLGPVLDRLADESRSQRRRNAEAAARQLPIRLSFPLVGCTLPSFVLLTIVPLMAGTLSSLPGVRP